ncbi:MAG: HlyD family efflux transporter periplasmic adaptor subunit, partial [Lachnospiraceae bacterium]
MSEKKEFSNIRPYKKKWQFNIGLIIFGTIFIYLLASVLLYVTASHVSAYEVREGTILKDNAYTGIAIRNEEVIAADRDGYINYYVSEGSKVAVGANIYSIVNDKMDMGNASITEGTSPVLSKEMQNKILLKMQKFNSNFDSQNFEDTYSFKSDIEDTILNASSQTRIDQLNAKIASEGI